MVAVLVAGHKLICGAWNRYLVSLLLSLLLIICSLPVRAEPAQMIDWQQYADTKRYKIEIRELYYDEMLYYWSIKDGFLRQAYIEAGFEHTEQSGDYAAHHQGCWQVGGYKITVVDQNSKREVVSQVCLFKMTDLQWFWKVIPEGAEYPDIIINKDPKRSRERMVRSTWGSAVVRYNSGLSMCRWNINYRINRINWSRRQKCLDELNKINWYCLESLDGEDKNIYVKKLKTEFKVEHSDIIKDVQSNKCAEWKLDVHDDNYTLGNAQIMAVNVHTSGYYPSTDKVKHYGAKDYSYFLMYATYPQLPGLFFEMCLPVRGKIESMVPTKETADPKVSEYTNMYRRLLKDIREKIVPELAKVHPAVEWQQPVWNGGETVSTQKETTQAREKTGEDEGTEIKPDIIEKDKPASGEPSLPGAVAVSVGGALAAAGAAAAARGAAGASSSESGEEEEKKRSIYKMFINKDFGNKLRPGDPPRTVGARIEEIKEGCRIKRDDLTRKIQVSAGENMSVLSRSFSGHYLEAGIQACVPSGAAAKEAAVVFSYSSEGGCFENHIVFQLVGDVRIVFPDLASDGQGLNLNSDNSRVAMVAGAGGTERLRFLFLDNTEEPENIVFIGDRSFSIRAERDDKYPSCYFAVIDNHSASLQKENGIFAGRKDVEITVEAVFADKSKVRGAFTIELYPQGLSVLINSGRNNLLPRDPGLRRVLKDGCLEVLSYATRDKGELTFDPLIRPTGFDLCFAAVKSDGTASVTLEAKAFAFGRMQPADEATRNILAKYEYTIGTTGGFSVEPQSELPEIGGRYLVKLPVRASWEGCAEQGEIPIRLLGEPLDVMREWNAEYKALKDSVIRNFPAEWAHRHIQYIEQEYSDPSLYDKTQLRILRVSLLRASQEYWLSEGRHQMWLDSYYAKSDFIFKKIPRFIGDVAAKIAIKYYFGEKEKWITPIKDLIVDTIDEVLGAYANGEDINAKLVMDSLLEKGREQLVNGIENYIDVDNPGAAVKGGDKAKLAIALTCYILADWIKNYIEMNPKNFWESWRKTSFDVTSMAVRKIIGAKLSQAINSKTMQSFYRSRFANWLSHYLPGSARGVFYKPGIDASKHFETSGNVDLPLVREDHVWTATGRKTGVKIWVRLSEDTQFVGLRELIQEPLDQLFGNGIALLFEDADETTAAKLRGILTIPLGLIYRGFAGTSQSASIGLDLSKLFSSEQGLASKAAEFLLNCLFGGILMSNMQNMKDAMQYSADPAGEILKL